ncbi:Oidioi.mRNA.OKI2018_I69.XSR.g15170.t2.cds [Oikopleura dioica]|uniref:Oidioi.mRNA.OKI2018_I69.XSR.g15170.t2.cds n=1 Tax=Oikopleura dioica TaxID=34765 RepID=A0ABN7SG45_OIKDI|nr:Oidioi.mRNA.OKI2018_I69.XSR.g15170.t2.cds [Oikopleura dioica]
MNGFGRASLAQINLIGCKECSFKCTDRRYLAAHSRIEHRQNTDPADDDFVDKLVVFVNDTTVKTEQIMESLVERAQGLVEELIDFKSSFPKCDNITAKYDYHDVDNTMEQVETSVETSSTTESGLFSDFGLSALSNLTQLARLTQNNASTTAASNTESQSGTGMFNNVSASNSKNNNILSSSISSSNSKSANTAKSTTITIAPKQANSSTTSLSNPVVITLDQLKQATTHHTMKESQRQRAHPENAPACPICGRVCSTTWNLKQHIEKHYDIHPQKGVVKKKFEETRSAATNNSLGSNSGAALAVNPATSLSFAPSPSSPSSSSLGIIELPTSSNDMSDSNEVTVKQEPLDEVENITGSVSKLAARSFPASLALISLR